MYDAGGCMRLGQAGSSHIPLDSYGQTSSDMNGSSTGLKKINVKTKYYIHDVKILNYNEIPKNVYIIIEIS